MERMAQCHCGTLKAIAAGEPERVYVCHCRACQRRTGAVVHSGARYLKSQVRITRASSGQTLPAKETDVPLAGDFLWVPERADNPAWPYIRDSILIMAQLATVAIAFRH